MSLFLSQRQCAPENWYSHICITSVLCLDLCQFALSAYKVVKNTPSWAQWFGFLLDYVIVTVYDEFDLATVHAYCDGGVLWKYFMLVKIFFQQAVWESRCFVGRLSSCFLMPLFLVDWSFLVFSVSPLYPTHLFWVFSIFNKQRKHWLTDSLSLKHKADSAQCTVASSEQNVDKAILFKLQLNNHKGTNIWGLYCSSMWIEY